MPILLFLLFVVVPLAELAILVKLGRLIGFWPTLASVVAMALVGTAVLRYQGFLALRRASEAMAQGRAPILPVVDGVFLLLAGALFLTPGFLTDIAGLLLLVPPIRAAAARWCLAQLLNAGPSPAQFDEPLQSAPEPHRRPRGQRSAGPIIEGEFERLDE